MKGYYINFGSKDVNLKKKIKMQIDYLKRYFRVEIIDSGYFAGSAKISTVLYRIPILNIPRFDYNRILEQIDSPDFIYFRKITTDLNVIIFLKKIKQKYPKCKIIIEIPTFPYYREQYAPIFNFTLFPKEIIFSKFYKRYVDRFVTYSNEDQIFGVRTIKTINGIDTDRFQAITPRADDGEIHLLAVAMFQRYHGYERILKGLHEYYSKGGRRKVKLFMVGEGTELQSYKDLSEKYGLDERVMFYGRKQGEELEQIYDNSDIGLGTFGFFKIGIETSSSLKTKEYLSKGLPIAAGSRENFVNSQISEYYVEFPNDSSPVSIQRLIDFYDNILSSNGMDKRIIANKIHTIAVGNVSLSVTLKPIVDYIKSE